MALACAPELGLLTALHGSALAVLVPFLDGAFGMGPPGLLFIELAQLAANLAIAADLLFGRRGLAFAPRPEAEPDHLLEDDLVLRAFADAVVKLLPDIAAH